MRAGGAAALVAAIFLAGCSGNSAAEDLVDCPPMSSQDGISSGLDLPVPSWLPGDAPLPEGLSIRHIDAAGEVDTLTGVVAGGDADQIAAGLHDGLAGAGWEILSYPGFVPHSADAVVALHAELGWLVKVSVAPGQFAEMPVAGGDCVYEEAVQVQMLFTAADPAEERERYAGSSVSEGSAVAEVAGHRFESDGECVVHDGTWRFTPEADVTWVDLSITPEGEGQAEVVAGNAMVHDGVDDLMYVLTSDVPPGADPEITITDSGFSVQAELNDVIGEAGFVPGTIAVTCA